MAISPLAFLFQRDLITYQLCTCDACVSEYLLPLSKWLHTSGLQCIAQFNSIHYDVVWMPTVAAIPHQYYGHSVSSPKNTHIHFTKTKLIFPSPSAEGTSAYMKVENVENQNASWLMVIGEHKTKTPLIKLKLVKILLFVLLSSSAGKVGIRKKI